MIVRESLSSRLGVGRFWKVHTRQMEIESPKHTQTHGAKIFCLNFILFFGNSIVFCPAALKKCFHVIFLHILPFDFVNILYQ